MPCAECCAAAGGFYPPAAEQVQVQALVPSFAKKPPKQLQQPRKLTFVHSGGGKQEEQRLRQHQPQQQQGKQHPDDSEQENEQSKAMQKQLTHTQRRCLRKQVCCRSGDCSKNCERRSGLDRHTSSCIDDMKSDNCRSCRRISVLIRKCNMGEGNNAGPLGLADFVTKDTANEETTPEAQALGVAAEAQRGAISTTSASKLHIKALRLLQKLSPFPEGSGFIPSPLPHLHREQQNPQDAAGSGSAAAAAIAAAGASAVTLWHLENNRQSKTRIEHEQQKIEGQQAQQQQQETIEMEPLGWQLVADGIAGAAPLQQDNDVLLPERLENMLLRTPPITQQQPPPAQQQSPQQEQAFSMLQRCQHCTTQHQHAWRRNCFPWQKSEPFQYPQCIQDCSNNGGNNKNNSSSSNNSNVTEDCVRAPEIVPTCSTPSSCDKGSRIKRRPGSSSDWHQMAVLLHSLIVTEGKHQQPQQQHGHSRDPYATRAFQKAVGPSESALTETETSPAMSLAASSTATADEGRQARVGWASTDCGDTAAPILQQQQSAEPHLHQSLPADVAQQILRRITSASSELHRHHKGDEPVQHLHAQQQKDHLQQDQESLQQDLQQEQQQEHPTHGRGSGISVTCCCGVSSCRSFCAFLLYLLGDFRTEQKQHERLHLLLLQLLLLLLQQQLACAICRCDSLLVRQYATFVVEQVGQMLQQQQEEEEQLTPGLLVIDTDSVHHQKRVVLLLQLALMLRAWRATDHSSGSKAVVNVAYLCLLHSGVCFELREAAGDILSAAAIDELSTAIKGAAIETANTEIARFTDAQTATEDGTRTAGTTVPTTMAAAAAARKAGRSAGAVALCASITKAAVDGSSLAAAAAAELTASVACCFLLMLQHSTQPPLIAAGAPAAELKWRPCIREFSAEAIAPAFPFLLLMLLPALEHQSLKCESLKDTAATPLSLSLHAAEALHLLRVALLQVQQHQVWQHQHELQIVHQPRQRCTSKLLTQQQQQLLLLLDQQLTKLLSAAIRTCVERFDLLLPLLQRELQYRSESSRSRTSNGTSWNIVEAAAAATEAPLCCVCALVQLPRLALATATSTNSAGEAETLEEVVASLVNMLLRLVNPCGYDAPAPARAAREETAAAAKSLPTSALSAAAATTAAFGCFGKLLVALTEAARSVCMQVQQLPEAAAASGQPEAAAAAAALQQCFAHGAAAVVKFCLQSAASGRPLQQQGQVSDFIAAAADADLALCRFSSSLHKEQHQLQKPLVYDLLQQILQAPISDRRKGNNSCKERTSDGSKCRGNGNIVPHSIPMAPTSSAAVCIDAGDLLDPETICRSGTQDSVATAAAAATCGAAAVPLAWVAVEATAATALQLLARFIDDRKTDVASAPPPTYVAFALSNDTPTSNDAAAALTAGAAVRLLRIAWTRVVGPALREVCVPCWAPVAAAVTQAAPSRPRRTPTPAAHTVAASATKEPVQAGQQHALAIIETRGSLIKAFSSAMAAVASAATAAAGEPKVQQPAQHELQQLHGLQQDFTIGLQNATLAAAHAALSHEQRGGISCCCQRSSLQESCNSSYWSTAQHQDPVGVLQQLLRALLVHFAKSRPTTQIFRSSCNRCNEGSCLWPALLQVAASIASLRRLALQLLLCPLRWLRSQQQEEAQQQRQQQSQRQLLEIRHKLYACFSGGDVAAASVANNSNGSNGCCCCGKVDLKDFMQQDDWVQASDLLLELLKLLQQTARDAAAGTVGAELSCLAATAATVERAAAAERAYQRPPQTQ